MPEGSETPDAEIPRIAPVYGTENIGRLKDHPHLDRRVSSGIDVYEVFELPGM